MKNIEAKDIIVRAIGKTQVGYNPTTGSFFREGRSGWFVVTATSSHGYPHTDIDGRKVSCHRLAFAMMGQTIPRGMQVDHINGIKSDNRWINLRLVTASENRLAYRDNHRDTCPRNITKAGRRYRVELQIDGKRYRPYFDTIAEASDFVELSSRIKRYYK